MMADRGAESGRVRESRQRDEHPRPRRHEERKPVDRDDVRRAPTRAHQQAVRVHLVDVAPDRLRARRLDGHGPSNPFNAVALPRQLVAVAIEPHLALGLLESLAPPQAGPVAVGGSRRGCAALVGAQCEHAPILQRDAHAADDFCGLREDLMKSLTIATVVAMIALLPAYWYGRKKRGNRSERH